MPSIHQGKFQFAILPIIHPPKGSPHLTTTPSPTHIDLPLSLQIPIPKPLKTNNTAKAPHPAPKASLNPITLSVFDIASL